MNRLIVWLRQPCRGWMAAFATTLAFLACSNSNDVAGGVTDIGNSVAQEPDSVVFCGTVVNMQGKKMPAARLALYWDNGIEIVDSMETYADSNAQFELKMPADDERIGKQATPELYLYAESGALSGLSLPPTQKTEEIRIGTNKAVRGSISGATSGLVRIGGTHLMAEVQADGSFRFDSIPPGVHEKLIYSESDSVTGHIPFSIQDAGDTLVLPQLENFGGYLWNPDLDLLGETYGFTFSYADDVSKANTEWTTIDIEMNGDEYVFDHDGKIASSVNYVDGVSGKGVLLEPGQYIDLDTLNPTGGDFTLSLWTKWNGPNGEHQALFCQRAYWSDSTSRFQWHFESNTGSFTVMKSMPNYPEAIFFGDSSSVPVGEWAFLVLVSKDHMVSMFVNGKPVGSAQEFVPNELNRSVPFRVGGNEIRTETWNGVIDGVSIETRARSPEWIRAKYEKSKP